MWTLTGQIKLEPQRKCLGRGASLVRERVAMGPQATKSNDQCERPDEISTCESSQADSLHCRRGCSSFGSLQCSLLQKMFAMLLLPCQETRQLLPQMSHLVVSWFFRAARLHVRRLPSPFQLKSCIRYCGAAVLSLALVCPYFPVPTSFRMHTRRGPMEHQDVLHLAERRSWERTL